MSLFRDFEVVLDSAGSGELLCFRGNVRPLVIGLHGPAQGHDAVNGDDLHVVGRHRERLVRHHGLANLLRGGEVGLRFRLIPAGERVPSVADISSRVVGRALCSQPVKQAFIRRLAPGLSKRFGADFAKVGMYPIPILTRDIPGYLITPHTDTRWKGITVQLYLPKDDANTDIGTIFHEKLPDGSMPKKSQMRFARNSGYAFAVGDDTWHSADAVHNRVKTRDSILLTYFVDQGLLKILRNRGKRLGNFIGNEIRYRI